ncbi:beta-galactoside alpha-2,6-sialyltransferase 1 [Dorcoceras hygrometricum]|nr:beta-galactoside alpha-2,6-sialyltransferase 1 [Dorcoceras hygrometricum]
MDAIKKACACIEEGISEQRLQSGTIQIKETRLEQFNTATRSEPSWDRFVVVGTTFSKPHISRDLFQLRTTKRLLKEEKHLMKVYVNSTSIKDAADISLWIYTTCLLVTFIIFDPKGFVDFEHVNFEPDVDETK